MTVATGPTRPPAPLVAANPVAAADRLIHLAALTLAIIGTLLLLDLAQRRADPAILAACVVYATTLVGMLACSTLLHHAPIRSHRWLLRRLDHAAIFLLIAGTYTPFTIGRLHGMWAIGLTSAVWAGALVGAAVKLSGPVSTCAASTAAYFAVACVALAALQPLLAALDPMSVTLLGIGALAYTVGAAIHHCRSLPFRNPIWHALVLFAASCHFSAILHGVVLAAG